MRPTSSLRGENKTKLGQKSALGAVLNWCFLQVGWLPLIIHASAVCMCGEYVSKPNGRSASSTFWP